MTRDERDIAIDKIAQRMTDNMELEDLIDYFYADQFDYYEENYSDDNLLDELKKLDKIGD